jgi:Domain of unknown function (DUF3291)
MLNILNKTTTIIMALRYTARHCQCQPSSCDKIYDYYLAHMNYARLVAPLDDLSMSELQMAMDPVNALAKATPGFVWSLDGDASQQQRQEVPLLRDDPLLMPQLSLWTDPAPLQHFAFKSGHAMYLKRKREWFTAVSPPFAVCWWRRVDQQQQSWPTLKEAFEKCEHLKQHGPTADAFTFQTIKDFPSPTTTQ